MPAFKFHRAGDLPVYSTSHVYTGIVDRDQDRDLDGLMFCDLPWILEDKTGLAEVFERNWPQQQAYTRLFALGVDAYHLVYNMDYMANFSDASYPGLTGEISLADNNRFSRKLLWAQFVRGRPVGFTPAPPAEESSGSTAIQKQAAGQI
jgi:outer membrane PBP1 activator LpoA protein